MIKVKMFVVLLGVFSLGSIAGGMLDRILASSARTLGGSSDSTVSRAPSIRDGEPYLAVLDSQLHLTGSQASEMRSILSETRDEYKALCGAVRPRYNDVRDRARARLRALLSPDQQVRFDSIVNDENCNCPDQNKDQNKDRSTEQGN
jgi:hypothetical protein